MIQLTKAISLVEAKRHVNDVNLRTGKKVTFFIGDEKITGVIATLDCVVRATVQHYPLDVEITLSLIDTTIAHEDDLL